jgi:hypothetical protein
VEAGAGRGPLSDVPAAVAAALKQHPAVEDIHLTGSRAEGRSHDLSDWDFAVATDDFPTVAADLPQLLAPFAPLAQQWDPYASHACYMLLFPGPTKVDLLFLDEPREWSPPWAPSPENLEAIDRHFWDWILWLEQKRRGGKDETLDEGLANMFELMLRPMGATTRPRSIPEALAAYHAARDKLERRYNTTVPRALEREVAPAVSSAG